MERPPLRSLFLGELPAPLREAYAEDARLEERLGEAVAGAQARWPQLSLAPEVFVAFLGEKLASSRSVEALDRAHLEDLYLACAASRGLSPAVALIEESCFEYALAATERLAGHHGLAEDARQRVRQVLFVGSDGSPPRIGDYAGRGELRQWLRAVAVRTTLNVLRAARPLGAERDEPLLEVAAAHSPELAYMKELYRAQFREAFSEALRSLPSASQNLLRYYYVDRLVLGDIAKLYGVHEATISRRLDRSRAELLDSTRRVLQARLGLEGAEVDSILRLIRSGLEISAETLQRELTSAAQAGP